MSRSSQLLGLLRQALMHERALLLPCTSSATHPLSLLPRQILPGRCIAQASAASFAAPDLAAYRKDPHRVVQLFEGNWVEPTEANLCEYVKALVKLDNLDGSALSATLVRGAHASGGAYARDAGARAAARASSGAAAINTPQAQAQNSRLSGELFQNKGAPSDFGSNKNPVFVSKVEPSFWQQLWGTFRTLGVAFVIIAAISAVIDDRGMSPRSLLNNPDLKPQVVSTTKFADVKGVDEAKEELEEVVHYLQDPEKFTHLGGKLPKGVLLVGPPGTGKTMLARAIAGEAGVPFFYTSGSEFEEMFVGVGARRVRDLFKAAKASAPCIVFIDEIDAIGGSRNPKDQMYMKMTLNQMLVELDGFKPSEGVIVVAATNFPESLDKALIRPGRFDRHIVVPNPDFKGRQQILEVHFANVKKSPEVNLEVIARGTPGFSGADLANLVNVAALKAARDGSGYVDQAALEYAKDRIMMGAERKSAVISEENRRLTAFHEGGHALVAIHTDGALPVHKATILPRGMALGMVMQLPEKDDSSVSKRQLLARLDVLMGGRVAEEIIFGPENITTGASSDLQKATGLARAMVTKYGFSDKLGQMSIDYEDSAALSTEIRAIVEDEVRKLVNDAYERARSVLQRHKKELHLVADSLLEHETLSGKQINELLGKK